METSVPKDQVAIEFYLGIHKGDQETIVKHGYVPRRIYTASNKSYISLRVNSAEAMVRAQELFENRCVIDKQTLLMLRIQFTHKGFSHYATSYTTSAEPHAPFAPLLYKFMYPTDQEKDWGAWALHADLPLNQTSENGDVLIACEWLLIQ